METRIEQLIDNYLPIIEAKIRDNLKYEWLGNDIIMYCVFIEIANEINERVQSTIEVLSSEDITKLFD